MIIIVENPVLADILDAIFNFSKHSMSVRFFKTMPIEQESIKSKKKKKKKKILFTWLSGQVKIWNIVEYTLY